MAYTNRKNNVFECGGQRFALECGERYLTFKCGGRHFAFECSGQRFTFECGEPHFASKCGGQRAVPISAWRIFGKAGQ